MLSAAQTLLGGTQPTPATTDIGNSLADRDRAAEIWLDIASKFPPPAPGSPLDIADRQARQWLDRGSKPYPSEGARR